MYHHPKFRQYYYWIWITSLVYVFVSYLFNSNIKSLQSLEWYSVTIGYIFFFIPKIIPWIAIGYLFDYKKEAWISIGVIIISQLTTDFATISIFPNKAVPLFYQTLSITSYFLPYIIFGRLIFKDKKVWGIVLLGLISWGISSIVKPLPEVIILHQLVQWLDYTRESFYIMPSVSKVLIIPINFLVFSYVVSTLKQNRNYLNFYQINLVNKYHKGFATLMFTSLSLLFLISSSSFLTLDTLTRLGSPFIILSDIGSFLAIYIIALIYRNFLIEYSMQLYNKVGYWYLFITIPFINLIAWLYSLLAIPSETTHQTKSNYLNEVNEQTNDTLKKVLLFLIISLMILSIIIGFEKSDTNVTILKIVSYVISLALIAYYLFVPKGVWWLLSILGFIILLKVYEVIPPSGFSLDIQIIYLINIIILYPVFHLNEYEDVNKSLLKDKPE